jgi:hypothetical protein
MMSPRYFTPRRRQASVISFRLVCSAGILVQGGASDFLGCVFTAMEARNTWMRLLPHSNLRIQLFYPNRKRVAPGEAAAALRALANPEVQSAVARRRAESAQISPARSAARTAEICAFGSPDSQTVATSEFCQAGVVAPPDSLTGEIPVIEVASLMSVH